MEHPDPHGSACSLDREPVDLYENVRVVVQARNINSEAANICILDQASNNKSKCTDLCDNDCVLDEPSITYEAVYLLDPESNVKSELTDDSKNEDPLDLMSNTNSYESNDADKYVCSVDAGSNTNSKSTDDHEDVYTLGLADSIISEPLDLASSIISEPLELVSSIISEPLELASSIISEPLDLASSIISEPLELASSIISEPLELASSIIREPDVCSDLASIIKSDPSVCLFVLASNINNETADLHEDLCPPVATCVVKQEMDIEPEVLEPPDIHYMLIPCKSEPEQDTQQSEYSRFAHAGNRSEESHTKQTHRVAALRKYAAETINRLSPRTKNRGIDNTNRSTDLDSNDSSLRAYTSSDDTSKSNYHLPGLSKFKCSDRSCNSPAVDDNNMNVDSSLSKYHLDDDFNDDNVDTNQTVFDHCQRLPESSVNVTDNVTRTPTYEPLNECRATSLVLTSSHHAHEIDINKPESATVRAKSKRYIRNKNYCLYCKLPVLNFSRHIYKSHINEIEVQRIFSRKNRLERRLLYTNLRKKGNFYQNAGKVTKPMKKNCADYLPCPNCLGFYSRKGLWRHQRQCTNKKGNRRLQFEAQNLLVKHLEIDENLVKYIFPSMRADKTSLIAKSGPLICAFGAQYLKTHRKKHFVNIISTKMRVLSKLLQEIKIINPTVCDLQDALRYQNYGTIVEATKIVAKYDTEKAHYKFPTLAINISTSLKQCCNIAIMLEAEKQGSRIQLNTVKSGSDHKSMIQLIKENWQYDISNQAAADISQNNWNMATVVPLAKDLKTVKEYLRKKSEEAVTEIIDEKDNIAIYTQLLETICCRLLLLNRQKPETLQAIKTHDYLSNKEEPQHTYEEFNGTLIDTERVLIKQKRVCVVRIRKTGLLVLFDLEIQKDMEVLLSIRDKYVSKSNRYLFGNPGDEMPINGCRVLKKHAKLSGIKNPKQIFLKKLQNHLATLTQVFIMSQNDLQELANSIGYSTSVHKNIILDDIYQAAKIAKLVWKPKADKQNSSLDQIPLTEYIQQLIEEEASPVTCSDLNRAGTSGTKSSSSPMVSLIKQTEIGKRRCLVPWTKQQKKIVTAFFKHHIKNRKAPKKRECEELKEKHRDILQNKDWLKIKVFVQNVYTKKLLNV